MRNEFQPVIIIGAGRSGTNMLRDILAKIPGFGTWHCDEINYIWRYGTARHPNDELRGEHATESVKKYIRGAFACVARKQGLNYVVEKTCANSLRVGFVERIFPEAKFIFIVRDGRDVVASALKRWKAFDLPYLLRKARFVPLRDIPYYGIRYMRNQLYRFISHERRIATWGACFNGMERMLHTHDLSEVCAEQWVRCVEKSEHDLQRLDPIRVHRLRYEDFVTSPSIELMVLANFLKVDLLEDDVGKFVQGVTSKSVGNWKRSFDQDTLELLGPLIRVPMKRYGYLWL